jgi:hypothetical protein
MAQECISATPNLKVSLKVPKDAHLGSFEEYMAAAGLLFDQPPRMNFSAVYKRIVLLTLLKSALSPVLESCILMDW